MKLLKMAASWCQPCKMLSMTIKDVDHPLISTMEEIDIDKNIQLAQKYNVRSVPTMIIVDEDGTEIRRVNGAISKERILDFLA